MKRNIVHLIVAAIGCQFASASPSAADAEDFNPPPTAQDWQALANLPDWSGIWVPDVVDQVTQEKTNPPPWKADVARKMAELYAEEKAGRPFPIIDHCFPTGMPSWMLITHNALEILLTPGRVTLLGEGDGNRLRRIYTDGRPHPEDPDPTFHGHSIGRWDKNTLVVDTVAVLPAVYLAVSEAVGATNNGDMHIVERLYLDAPDTLIDELKITANKLLTKPWTTKRRFVRHRERKYDIVEGVCTQGSFTEGVDKDGNAVFVPIKFHNGVPVGSD